MQTTLTRILIVLESVSHGLSENSDEISLKARKFEGFFRPKSGGLQKEKKKVFAEIESDFSAEIRNSKVFSAQSQVVSKKKEKKRSSPKLSLIFRPKSKIQRFFPPKIRWSPKKKRSSPKLSLIFRPNSEIQTFQGVLFSYGGAIFNFSQKIGLKSIKNVRFCILRKPMGGAPAPPPPPCLRYWTRPLIESYRPPSRFSIPLSRIQRLPNATSALSIKSRRLDD